MAERQVKVKGTALRYVDWANNWREQTGTLSGGSGTPGKFWPEVDRFYYNDNNGDTRYLALETIVGSDTPLKLRVKGDWVRFIKSTGDIREWHDDVAYGDVAHVDWDDHNDVAHVDWDNYSVYSDHDDHPDHNDAPHGNYSDHDDHPDAPYYFEHADHANYAYTDHQDYQEHSDHTNWSDHNDTHTDWDNHNDSHTDTPHVDEPHLI